MKENERTIKDMLGLDTAPTGVQTASSTIGAILFGIGFLGALRASDKQKTYIGATKDTQAQINQILPTTEARNIEAQKALGADLAGYSAKTEAGIKQGLINRGITDKGIGEQSAGQFKEGVSGAYAMASSALSRAKLNATMGVSGALSAYQQQLAVKQYESMMAKYYSKVGIWGSLGGLGASMLAKEGPTATPNPEVDYNDYILSVEEMTKPSTPFRMKGVTDSKPFRMKGVK